MVEDLLCECVSEWADFLGNWRKEKRRLKELLLMGCGWWNVVGWWASPSFHPGFSGVGVGSDVWGFHGRLSSLWDRAEEKTNSALQQQRGQRPFCGSQTLLRCCPTPAQVILPSKYSSPRGPYLLLAPSLCFLSACLRDFRWGSLRIEQARAVLNPNCMKVKVFLSLAKDPLLKDTPRCGQNGIPLLPLSRQ